MCSAAQQGGPKNKLCIVLFVWRGGSPESKSQEVRASPLGPSLKRFTGVQLGLLGRPYGHLGHFEVKRRPRVGPPVNSPSPHRTAFRPHPQIPSVQIRLAAVIEPPAACQRGWRKSRVSCAHIAG